ncbi:MAG: M35 family metallo-endopeptidase [Acidobacteriota bacterium]
MRLTKLLMIAVAVLAVLYTENAVAATRTPEVACKIEALDWYAPTEPITVRFSLENRSAESIWVLRWQMPSDEIDANIFEITRNGEAVQYVGPLVKRAEPIAEDYVEIRAGQAFEVAFDPSAVYDMTAQGQYSIRYRVRMLDVRSEAPGSEPAAPPMLRAKVIESSPIGLWFEGLDRPAGPVREIDQIIGGYTKCTTSQQASMQTAHNSAVSISNKAISHLASNPNGSSLYTYWFGTYTSSRFNTVKAHYNSIWDAFVNKSVVYDCGCKKRYYAYVYPNQPYKIYVCKVFWTAPNLGRDSRAGTLVHEMSHFYVTASTDDYVYGATGAHNLAVSDPTKAIDNADNHEYFAEDQP